MRWFVFAVLAYVLLALQVSSLGEISLFGAALRPQPLVILAVFVGLSAPGRTAMMAWGVLGLLLDLTSAWPLPGDRAVTIVGPYTLGFLAAGYTLYELRSMLFRQHPLTLAAMTIVCGIAVNLVVVGVFTVRDWYDPLAYWSARGELLARGMALLYTGLIAAVLAIPLIKIAPLFAFQHSKSAVPWGRRR